MILWIIFAVMAAIVAGAVLYALRPGGQETDTDSQPDIAVYRDQLAALDDELESGLIDEKEAETARIEISRRLLNASKVEAGLSVNNDGSDRRVLAIVCSLVVVGVSLGAYLYTGSPELPDQPFAARQDAPPETQDMATLVGRMEEHLAANPQDGRGWDILAPIYLRMGRAADAAKAFSQAMDVQGPSEPRLSGLGEALVQANNGNVTEQARAAFAQALSLEPNALRPKFFLIVAQEQDGDVNGAITSWRTLLDEAPADIPWRDAVAQRITMLEARANGAPDSAANLAPGPTEEQVQQAGERTPEERRAMINNMVTQLAERLTEDGDDIDGWLRLIRSYAVLGQLGKAKTAMNNARAQFALSDPTEPSNDNATALSRLDELAVEAGLE